MSVRTLRIAKYLAYKSDRVAVRPFPLTDEMKQIIKECREHLLDLTNRGKLGRDNIVYFKNIQLHNQPKSLFIRFTLDPSKTQGVMSYVEEANMIDVVVNFPVPSNLFIRSLVKLGMRYKIFWAWFQSALHHELVHVFDPKITDPSLRDKIDVGVGGGSLSLFEGKEPSSATRDVKEQYYRNPAEKSAHESEQYYWFKYQAERGRDMKKVIRSFLSQKIPKYSYSVMVKGFGVKEWQEYQTRVYKLAEQAYQDVAKERGLENR